MRTTAIRLAFAALAVAFFATPIALRAVGVTAEAFENRRFADPPKLSQGWNAFQQTQRFLIDRMPLRAQATRANTHIWTDIFGTVPRYAKQVPLGQELAPVAGQAPDGLTAQQRAAQVLPGEDGWLFLLGEQQSMCAPPAAFEAALERWSDLIALVRTSGRAAVAFVAPDKGSIYPEHLPDDHPFEDCAPAGKRALWSLLGRAGPRRGVVTLRDRLLREKRRAGDSLYQRKDSHWTTLGSLAFVRAALSRVGGGLRLDPGEVVDPGESTYTGDLTQLLGDPQSDVRPNRGIRRAPGARRVPGRTVLVGDSFADMPLPQLEPYFEDLRFVKWDLTPAAKVAAEIALADIVIVETVERDFLRRTSDRGPVSPAFLDLVRSRLSRAASSGSETLPGG